MAKNPDYVKLAPAFQARIVADVRGGSGWSISGLNVDRFPNPKDNKPAFDFVRQMVRSGRLVAATEAEYNVMQAQKEAFQQMAEVARESKLGHQEVDLQLAAKAARRKIIEVFDGEIDAAALLGSDDDDEPDDGGEEPTFKGKTKAELMDLNKDELQDMAEEEGVDKSGKKEEIVDRLLDV